MKINPFILILHVKRNSGQSHICDICFFTNHIKQDKAVNKGEQIHDQLNKSKFTPDTVNTCPIHSHVNQHAIFPTRFVSDHA